VSVYYGLVLRCVQSKALCQHAVLYVSGDALRVIDDLSKVCCAYVSVCTSVLVSTEIKPLFLELEQSTKDRTGPIQ